MGSLKIQFNWLIFGPLPLMQRSILCLYVTGFFLSLLLDGLKAECFLFHQKYADNWGEGVLTVLYSSSVFLASNLLLCYRRRAQKTKNTVRQTWLHRSQQMLHPCLEVHQRDREQHTPEGINSWHHTIQPRNEMQQIACKKRRWRGAKGCDM